MVKLPEGGRFPVDPACAVSIHDTDQLSRRCHKVDQAAQHDYGESRKNNRHPFYINEYKFSPFLHT